MCVRYSINHKNIESSITMQLNRGRGQFRIMRQNLYIGFQLTIWKF